MRLMQNGDIEFLEESSAITLWSFNFKGETGDRYLVLEYSFDLRFEECALEMSISSAILTIYVFLLGELGED